MKKVMVLAAVIAVVWAGYWFYNDITGNFSSDSVAYDLSYDAGWQQQGADAEQQALLDAVASQSFRWLGHGRQTFAFESADGSMVLKIFKIEKLRPWSHYWHVCAKVFPRADSWFDEAEKKRQRRIEKLFTGYKTAYGWDRENTGISYVHLAPTHNLNKKVVVADFFGFKHTIDLDNVIFAIQPKAIKMKVLLTKALQRGDQEAAKRYLSSLFYMFVDEYKRGIIDNDQNVMHNSGFCDNKPLRIDVGQLRRDDPIKPLQQYRSDLQKVADKRLKTWLSKTFPAYESVLSHYMDDCIAALFQETSRAESS